jgi:hypothetical protein
MKNILTFLLLFSLLTSCGFSTQKGKYIGVLVDVSYSGLIFKSCELMFKTSQESSKFEESSISIASEKDCDAIAEKMGQKFIVEYQNSLLNPFIETNYLIKSLKNL